MPEPKESRLRINGIELQVYEWPGEGQPVFLAHATGFHARCWDQVVAHLPGRHVFAIDMRGHGRSDKPEPPYAWPDFGRDVAGAVRALGIEGAIGVGHSKGGFAVAHAAALEPGAFASLLLIDPVIMRREMYDRKPEGEHFAARRRNEWSSPDEMFERFRNRPPFASWDEQVLRDYCTYGLLPNPNGEGYVLACPPHIEASIYTHSSGGGVIYDSIAAIDIPVRILRARMRTEGAVHDMSNSPTNPDLASYFKQAEDIYLPERSHFIPMEAPGFVAQHIQEMSRK